MRVGIAKFGLRAVVRAGVPVVILVGCIWLIAGQVGSDLWRDLPRTLAAVHPLTWCGAVFFTALSLLAVGRYDAVAHRHLQTGIPEGQARLSGMGAISVAQTLGFGLFTGAIARWRLLPDLSLPSALGLSAFVSFSFVVAWALVTALVCLLLPAPEWTRLPAAFVILIAPLGIFVLFRWPHLKMWRLSVRLPSLKSAGDIVLWSFVDTITAAAALWLLLPAEAEIAVWAFVPIYLLALGAALISNTPGGVGPFELVLLGALPHVSAEALLQSVIAFRVVYYALPAVLGALMLLRPFPRQPFLAAAKPSESMVLRAPRSEVAVVSQNGGEIAETADGVAALWPTAQTVTGLFAPLQGSHLAMRQRTVERAETSGRFPLLYKVSARAAVEARRNGWSVLHIADDAMLCPQNFSLEVPARRTLRRKLRAAEKSGLRITVPARLPLDEMAQVDAEWCARLGPARGGTMGRFAPDYVQHQWVATARQDGRLVAFVSFFATPYEWSLDLMRQTETAPDGTMHSLVMKAIEAATTAGVPSVSLAATPACPDPQSAVWRRFAEIVVSRAGGPGLRQFKSAFAPTWVPRYAAAPAPASLLIGLADIARAIHAPDPLPSKNFHEVDENYELELQKRA